MIEKASTVATYGGSAGALFFGLSANEFAAFGGLFIAVIGLAVNIWFKWQNHKLSREFRRVIEEE